ncbi:hypothetical protein E2C01_001883 [Portunus trituberculatus]|uniref:Uncharacterized protein n=1 Tax=Portunus trituberculatus TaxID=210409 RepID=A0A5B7CID7_PORTR|nr:hypothetical protein [Portunus trituberculatus]
MGRLLLPVLHHHLECFEQLPPWPPLPPPQTDNANLDEWKCVEQNSDFGKLEDFQIQPWYSGTMRAFGSAGSLSAWVRILSTVPAPGVFIRAQQCHIARALHCCVFSGYTNNCHSAKRSLPHHFPGVSS